MPGDSTADSAVSVWPTLAPRSAIEIDLFPRLPDDKEKVFRIRAGHVTGWMQRAIEGLPANVVSILNALRAFGVCYQFYREHLRTPPNHPCGIWLEGLKATLYAYIGDEASHPPENSQTEPPFRELHTIGRWLQGCRTNNHTGPFQALFEDLETLLDHSIASLKAALGLATAKRDGELGTAESAHPCQAITQELERRTRQLKSFAARLVTAQPRALSAADASLLAEYALVIRMKVELVRLSVSIKEWAQALQVEEKQLTIIGNQLWHVCNQLCSNYHRGISGHLAPLDIDTSDQDRPNAYAPVSP